MEETQIPGNISPAREASLRGSQVESEVVGEPMEEDFLPEPENAPAEEAPESQDDAPQDDAPNYTDENGYEGPEDAESGDNQVF